MSWKNDSHLSYSIWKSTMLMLFAAFFLSFFVLHSALLNVGRARIRPTCIFLQILTIFIGQLKDLYQCISIRLCMYLIYLSVRFAEARRARTSRRRVRFVRRRRVLQSHEGKMIYCVPRTRKALLGSSSAQVGSPQLVLQSHKSQESLFT